MRSLLFISRPSRSVSCHPFNSVARIFPFFYSFPLASSVDFVYLWFLLLPDSLNISGYIFLRCFCSFCFIFFVCWRPPCHFVTNLPSSQPVADTTQIIFAWGNLSETWAKARPIFIPALSNFPNQRFMVYPLFPKPFLSFKYLFLCSSLRFVGYFIYCFSFISIFFVIPSTSLWSLICPAYSTMDDRILDPALFRIA